MSTSHNTLFLMQEGMGTTFLVWSVLYIFRKWPRKLLPRQQHEDILTLLMSTVKLISKMSAYDE